MAQYTRTGVVNAAPGGDTVKTAVATKHEADLTGLTAAYNAHDTATTTVHGFTGTKTGSGAMVGATSPTLVTPTLGAAVATSINGLTLTASTGAFTLTNLKVFTVQNTLTLSATDGSTLAIGTGGTLGTAAYTAATAYEASGNVSSHAALITGIHGLVFTAGKALTLTESLTLNALPVGGLAVATAANTLGSLTVGLTTQILVGGGVGTVPAFGTDIPTAVTIGSAYIYRAAGADIPVTDGGTGVSTLTTAYGLLAAGTTATGNVQTIAAGATTQILVGGGASALPAWGTDLPTAVTIGTAYVYRAGGTDVPVADGGTGVSTFAINGVLYGNGTSAIGVTAIGAEGQILRVGASPFVPAWTTATYPATTTINQILYSSAANVISGLATGNSSILVTNGSGVPSLATDIPTAVTIGGKYIYRAEGTDIPVADGGTGASTLTDHGILLGSGTDAITAMTALGAGEIIIGVAGADPHVLAAGATTAILVGGGAADPVWTAATGTGSPVRADSPIFTTQITTPQMVTVDNAASAIINIPVTGTDSTTHTLSLQVDGNTGLSIAATGTGAGAVGANTINLGVSGNADVIHIGDANALVDVTDAHWSITEAGVLSIVSMGANWTNAGRTVADAGILTTVDINGGSIDGATIGGATPAAGSFTTLTNTGAHNTAYATVASHATTSAIWAAAGNVVNFTGTETITDFPAAPQAGSQRILICAGACIFTHAGSITVQGGVTRTAVAGDMVIVTATTTTAFKVNFIAHTETGTGATVRATSPTLVTPALGTPSSGNLASCTGYPINLADDATPQLAANLDPQGFSTNWSVVPTASFTATPTSTSTITMGVDLTAKIKAGMGLQYVISGVTYYGQVSAIAANLLTVRGAPLGGDVTALYYGGGTVRQVVVIIPGTYEDASNTALITSDLKSNLIWTLPLSYLVYFSVYSNVHDSGATHGQASVRINNTEVNTTAGGELIAANTTWYPTVVNIATAAYDINPGELLEVTSVKGSTGDASDLTVLMIFVTP
jgi:hypothetical protein